MIYAYTARSFNLPQQLAHEIRTYARSRGLPLEAIIQDQESQAIRWQNRKLALLLKQMQNGDSLLVYEASDIGLNFEAVAEFLGALIDKEIKLHLIKYQQIFRGEKLMPANHLIELFGHIESDFIALEAVYQRLQKKTAKSL
ncbi:MAG: hypothetical protein K0S29_269 [Gammaproteobacteria bacterium]|jgi:DNA invertase Pin-like site-specific DNA recombinase|nr:hypothetical protein [Gammaproteobacteria bacterium]